MNLFNVHLESCSSKDHTAWRCSRRSTCMAWRDAILHILPTVFSGHCMAECLANRERWEGQITPGGIKPGTSNASCRWSHTLSLPWSLQGEAPDAHVPLFVVRMFWWGKYPPGHHDNLNQVIAPCTDHCAVIPWVCCCLQAKKVASPLMGRKYQGVAGLLQPSEDFLRSRTAKKVSLLRLNAAQ